MNTPQYLNNTVWCRLAPSPIHGVGVVAIRDISKGQILYTFDHHMVFDVDEEDFMKILPEIRALILDKIINAEGATRYRFFSPNDEQIIQSFMNHSSDANSDGHIALRDIKKGEEITEDYNRLGVKMSKLNKDNFTPL
jgi:SET domain-containing protein